MRAFLRRLWHLVRHRQAEADLAEELDFHRAMKERELTLGGHARADAARDARRALGSVALAQDQARDVCYPRWIQDRVFDVRHAGRTMRRHPGSTAVVILTLSLGSYWSMRCAQGSSPWSPLRSGYQSTTRNLNARCAVQASISRALTGHDPSCSAGSCSADDQPLGITAFCQDVSFGQATTVRRRVRHARHEVSVIHLTRVQSVTLQIGCLCSWIQPAPCTVTT